MKEPKEILAKELNIFIKEKHTQEECTGFINGFEKAMEEYASQSKWVSVEEVNSIIHEIPEWEHWESHCNENSIVDEGYCVKSEDVLKAFKKVKELLKLIPKTPTK